MARTTTKPAQEQIVDVAVETVAPAQTEKPSLFVRCMDYVAGKRWLSITCKALLIALVIMALALMAQLLIALFGGAITFAGAIGCVATTGVAVAAAGYGSMKYAQHKLETVDIGAVFNKMMAAQA